MKDVKKGLLTWIDMLWKKISDQVWQDVPQEIAACEFGCNRKNCLVGEWEKCERRKWEASV